MADVAEQVRTEVEEWTTEAAEKAVTTGAFLLNEIANRNGLGQNGAGSKVSDNSESDGATSEESGSEEEGGGPSQVETGLKAFTTANDQKVSDILEFDGTTSGNEIGARTGESSKDVGEVVEEEIVELEFDKVKPKLATHSMHCPHCKSEITKVTLRRKVLLYRPPAVVEDSPVVPPEPQPETDPEEPLVGCLSCLSVFTFSGNGRFKAFDIFPKNSQSPPSAGETESCLSMFWVTPNPNPIAAEAVDPPQAPLLETVNVSRSPVGTDVEAGSGVVRSALGRSWLGYEGVLAEILKSIVYGGLLEVIASLSVVASAAASDASTLSIISVALATLIGGIFVIGHNLWDLKDDCHKATSNNEEAASKYKELLGQVNYFPLHAFFAMLSFLVFGMVPPAAYGFAFHKTNDKDFTIMAAATASLICVVLLAIFKSFINKCTTFGYFKTVVYYITTAVSVSGVSYVAGNLLTRLMEEYGLFDMSLGDGMSLLSHATTPSLSSF